MNDIHQRELLRRALDAIDQASSATQHSLNERVAGTMDHNPGPLGIGRMMALSRRCDAMNRIAHEIHELLDEWPTRPTAAPERLSA